MAKKEKGFAVGHDEKVGRGDFANMPQDVKMIAYPKSKQMRGGYLDDTMVDIDECQKGAEAKAARFKSYQK